MTIPQHQIHSYGGFTIGPIGDMLQHAGKTRELWFGSYFFSWYMEQLVGKLASEKEANIDFLTPYVNLDPHYKLKPNEGLAGKYHDRFVACSSLDPQALYDEIKAADESVRTFFVKMIDELAKKTCKKNGSVPYMDSTGIREVFDGYLQVRFLTLAAEDTTVAEAVGRLDEYLNTLEQSFLIAPGKSPRTCDRCKTLPGLASVSEDGNAGKTMVCCPFCLMKLRAHRIPELRERVNGKLHNKKLHYPSVGEIAMAAYFKDTNLRPHMKKCLGPDGEIDDAAVNAILEKNNLPRLKPCHKYMAIVQADGDKLGKLAKSLDDPNALSRRLFDFAEDMEILIKAYGGVPVYLGGDDVLAFMPVLYRDTTVLDFLKAASGVYTTRVDEKAGKTFLSFGVNIAYRKFPLARAREAAEGLLFGMAKGKDVSNRAAFRLTAHSGSTLDFVVALESDDYESFTQCLSDVMTGRAEIPRGIHYKLKSLAKLLPHLSDADRCGAFFENQFNELVHAKQFGEGLRLVRGLLQACLKADLHAGVDRFLNMLKFLRFLTGEEV